jgi:Protein of unknown function (DUF3592)
MRRIARGNLFSILFGLCLIAGGAYAYARIDDALRFTREAPGVVEDVVYESGTKKGRVHPVVRYRTAEGTQVRGQSDKHVNVRPGDEVQVVYDLRNPGEVEIGNLAQARRRRAIMAAVVIAIGIASLLAGIALHLGLIRVYR